MAYKVWWYSSGSKTVPFMVAGSTVVGNVMACTLELASWIYRISLTSSRVHAITLPTMVLPVTTNDTYFDPDEYNHIL